MSETCRIQWIDDDGRPTPDQSQSIGTITLTRTYTRGTGVGGAKEEAQSFPCCADHYRRGVDMGLFGRVETSQNPGFDYRAVWTFTPNA